MSLVIPTILKSFKKFQTNLGAVVLEMGLQMDRAGSRLSEDIAYAQPLSRHRKIMPIEDDTPKIDNGWVAENATLIGEVFVDPYASVWYNAVLRAESSPIRFFLVK